MSKGYPIRHLAKILGVPTSTLRTWEKRYKLFAPTRSDKGHRRYGLHDVEVAHRLRHLLEEGDGIGSAVQRLQKEAFSQPDEINERGSWDDYRSSALAAIARYDTEALNTIFHHTLHQFPEDLVMQRFVTPLFDSLGESWDKHPAGIAEEHFASSYFVFKLGSFLNHQLLAKKGIPILVATLPGERHEIGLLVFCLTLLSQGFQPIYAGADLPLDQHVSVVKTAECRGVLLSGKSANRFLQQKRALSDLKASLSIPLFLGGAAAALAEQEVQAQGLIPVGDTFHHALKVIKAHM